MKKCALALLLSFMLTVFSGCGEPADASSPEEGAADVSSSAGEENISWLQEGFTAPGELETGNALWAGQYLPIKHSAAEGEDLYCVDSGVCGRLFWYLCQSRDAEKNAEAEYVLEIYDTAAGKSTVKRFTPKEMGLSDGLGFLIGMDMPDEAHFMFRWAGYEQDSEEMYLQTQDKMIYTDLAGNFRIADLWNVCLERGILQQTAPRELPLVQEVDWRCGKDGSICVLKGGNDNGGFQIFLFDRNGELLLEKAGTETQQLASSLRTSGGELIFPVYDSAQKCYEFLWADTNGKELRSIARVEASSPDIVQIYGMLGDDLYYKFLEAGTARIVKWNVVSGTRELVLDLREAGIEKGYETLLALEEGKTPVLSLSRYKEGQRREWLTTLLTQKPVESEAIRVVNLMASGESQELVKACAAAASMDNPSFSYEYEDASGEEGRARILAELTQGKGPDLLLVSPEDMYMLAEKDVLLDMSSLLSEELRNEILPGALEIGTTEGKLSGIPPTVTAETLAAGTDVWPEDTWKLEDIIGLMDEGKVTCAIRNLPDLMNGKYSEPLFSVISLLNYSLADSFLIDWENRKCHFDDERFIRLLELCAADMSDAPVNMDSCLNGGRDILWGYFHQFEGLFEFFERMEAENGRVVGYPTAGAGGSYLRAEGGVLVVSAGADPESAAYFLETLLGKEIQSKTQFFSISVRRPSQEDYVTEESGRLLYKKSSGEEMPVFADGDTPFQRAKAFLESCTAAPDIYSQIKSILLEELRTMYAENRSPRKTAEDINNRVQIYLDEGN